MAEWTATWRRSRFGPPRKPPGTRRAGREPTRSRDVASGSRVRERHVSSGPARVAITALGRDPARRALARDRLFVATPQGRQPPHAEADHGGVRLRPFVSRSSAGVAPTPGSSLRLGQLDHGLPLGLATMLRHLLRAVSASPGDGDRRALQPGLLRDVRGQGICRDGGPGITGVADD